MLLRVAFIVVCLSCTQLHAQRTITASDGSQFVIEYYLQGDSLFKLGQYDKSIEAFRKEYAISAMFTSYNLACAFAKANEPDSAFKYLFEDLKFDSSKYPLTNPDFIGLRGDKRWTEVVSISTNSIAASTPNGIPDLPLAVKLWDMSAWDQAYYHEIFIAEAELGKKSSRCDSLWKMKETVNIENQRLLDSIITVKGWPKNSQVGDYAASAAFLIIQHSTEEKQKKYLPIIKDLCEIKEASWESYALMYDRIQFHEGKPQLYGTQIISDEETHQMKFYPIEDEANVNKRRAEFGMMPIETYAEMMGVKYTPKK